MLKRIILSVILIFFVVIIVAALFMLRKDKKPREYIRSVTAIQLKEMDPIDKTKLTGVVEAWKEENLSFEVPGQIEWIIDKGMEIYGNKNAYSLTNGDGEIIAILDPEEYELRLKAANANINIIKEQINALKVTISDVFKEQLDAAKAGMENAEKEYKRLKILLDKQAASEKVFDAAETAFKKARAGFSEINAHVKVKKAELKGLEANLEQLEQTAADVKLDIKRTKLRVPFQGRIADVYVNIGAYVNPGQQIAKLVVMDPVIVDLNISAELDRKLFHNQFVNVYPPDSNKPITGIINRKATIADPNTHTFSLELLVRNKFIKPKIKQNNGIAKYQEIKEIWPITNIDVGGKEHLIVKSDCVYSDNHGDYLWKVEEAGTPLPNAQVYKVTKEYIKLYPDEHNFLGVYKYRIIKDSKTIKQSEFVASGVSNNIKSNDNVILIHKQRMFRPGDLVKVVLNTKNSEKGIYIPMKIVSGDSSKYWIYKVIQKKDGSSEAKQIFIQPKELFNDQVRIQSPELKEGDLIVYEGSHFITPGEKINVKSIEKAVL